MSIILVKYFNEEYFYDDFANTEKKLCKLVFIVEKINSWEPLLCCSLFLRYFFPGGENNYIDEDIMRLLSFSGVSYFTFRYFGNITDVVYICKKLSGK